MQPLSLHYYFNFIVTDTISCSIIFLKSHSPDLTYVIWYIWYLIWHTCKMSHSFHLIWCVFPQSHIFMCLKYYIVIPRVLIFLYKDRLGSSHGRTHDSLWQIFMFLMQLMQCSWAAVESRLTCFLIFTACYTLSSLLILSQLSFHSIWWLINNMMMMMIHCSWP